MRGGGANLCRISSYTGSSDGESVLRATRRASGRAHHRNLTGRTQNLTRGFDW